MKRPVASVATVLGLVLGLAICGAEAAATDLQGRDGLWQTAAAMPTYRLDLVDEEEGQVGLLGRISENGNGWTASPSSTRASR